MNPSADIFVSYASEDRERVRPLVAQLEQLGWTVWWDREITTGRLFDREIEAAIHGARCVLVLWSQASVESEWVRTEANEGLDRRILVPVLIDNVRPPLAYRRVQTNSLIGWPEGNHVEELRRLAAALQGLLGSRSPLPARTHEDIGGERRHVSVVSSRITERPGERDPEKTDEFVTALAGAIGQLAQKYGGYPYQSSGSRTVIVFGIPAAHEMDALMAVTLALQIQAAFKATVGRFPWGGGGAFSVESSVTGGLVVAREVKARLNEFAITGGSVIEDGARLLAQAPPNAIVASTETYQTVARYVEAEPLGRGDQPMYRIKSASAISSPIEAAAARGFTALCGRDPEVAHLLERFALAAGGSGQVVTVTGEAGIGKSRVLHEVRRRLPAHACQVLEARCHSYGGSTPYYPFLALLRTCLAVADLSGGEAHDPAVRAIVGIDPDLQRYLPHFLYLLSIPSTEHRLPKHLEGEPMRLALQEALVALLAVAARARPLVITLEDWHWADEASTAVLRHLTDVAASCAMLIVVSCRPEFQADWTTQEHCSVLKLAGVSLEQARSMLTSITGATEVPADLLTSLHQRTLGNPFFLEEVCTSLLERGRLGVREGRLEAEGGADLLGLPDSIQSVLRARLDRLDRETQEIVHCAAVIGREFSRRLLEVTCGRAVEPTLRALVELGILKQVRVVPEPEFVFRHALIQVVAYETLLVKARRRLHRIVGENIISLDPGGLVQRTEVLAYHFGLSDDTERALHFSVLAGERALARSAHWDAIKHLKAAEQRVAEQIDDPAVQRARLRILLLMGPALVVVDGYSAPGVIQAYLQARDYSRALGAAEEEFVALWGLWRYCNSSGLMDDSIRYSNQLLEIAQRNARVDQLHSAYAAVVGAETFGGNLHRAMKAVEGLRATYQWETEFELALRYGTPPMVVGLGIAANSILLAGNYSAALAAVQEALALAQQLKHPAAEATALYYLSALRTLGGDFAEANQANQRMRELAEKERMPQWIAAARFHDARAAMIAGRAGANPVEALADLVAKADHAVTYTPALMTPTRVSLATICVLAGHPAHALPFIAQGLTGIRFFRPELLRLQARALRSTAPEEALRSLNEAWSVAVEMDAVIWKLRIVLDRIAWGLEAAVPIDREVAQLKEVIDQFAGAIEVQDLAAARRRLAAL